MKSSLDQLSIGEKQALAHLYDTEGYKALKKIHNLELLGLGKDALVAPNLESVKFLNGRAHQSKVTIELIREAYKAVNKEG